MVLRAFLPERHLGEESRNIVTSLGIGLVGAMAGLVLALLITAAQNNFLNKRSELIEMSAKIIYLDEILADYGTETNEVRALLRNTVLSFIYEYWPGDASQQAGMELYMTDTRVLYNKIRSLVPRNDDQRSLRDKALTTSLELAQLRDLRIVEEDRSIPRAFLIVLVLLVFWIVSIFFSLGIYAPPNSTLIAIFVLFALLVAIAFFLIIDLNLPFEGVLRMPGTPLSEALDHIGR
jgi:hypothetical protein